MTARTVSVNACSLPRQQIAEIRTSNASFRKELQDQLIPLSQQGDRLKSCFDECVRSIGSCNATISSQFSSVEASNAGAISAVKRQIKDIEVATQRQIDALTQAVHALAAVLNIAPPRV
jgi:hypothetical protein